jgi:hypothetical protein
MTAAMMLTIITFPKPKRLKLAHLSQFAIVPA